MARETRERIDRALGACEEVNAVSPERPARWVLDLISELQMASGSLVWEPANTVEAHAALLDLQVHHLDTPPGEALAEALGQLAHARGQLRQMRERLAAASAGAPDRTEPAPTPALPILRELLMEVEHLRREVATMRAEARPREEATHTVALPAGGGLAEAVAAARRSCRMASEADLEEIAAAAGASLAQMRGPSRRRALVELRRIAARYLRARGCSLPEIGEALHRDHTSIQHLLGTPPRPGGQDVSADDGEAA